MFNRHLFWKLPLVVLIMYFATWTSFMLKIRTANDWHALFALCTPLVVALVLWERRAMRVATIMWIAFLAFAFLSPLALKHGAVWSQLMAERVMPLPGLVILVGLPYLLLKGLIQRAKGPAKTDVA